jgi:hypothetical protein
VAPQVVRERQAQPDNQLRQMIFSRLGQVPADSRTPAVLAAAAILPAAAVLSAAPIERHQDILLPAVALAPVLRHAALLAGTLGLEGTVLGRHHLVPFLPIPWEPRQLSIDYRPAHQTGWQRILTA